MAARNTRGRTKRENAQQANTSLLSRATCEVWHTLGTRRQKNPWLCILSIPQMAPRAPDWGYWGVSRPLLAAERTPWLACALHRSVMGAERNRRRRRAQRWHGPPIPPRRRLLEEPAFLARQKTYHGRALLRSATKNHTLARDVASARPTARARRGGDARRRRPKPGRLPGQLPPQAKRPHSKLIVEKWDALTAWPGCLVFGCVGRRRPPPTKKTLASSPLPLSIQRNRCWRRRRASPSRCSTWAW